MSFKNYVSPYFRNAAYVFGLGYILIYFILELN